MSLISKECIEFNDTRAICIASENGKSYQINNKSKLKVCKVKVDHCLTQKEGERRCDYLMSINEKTTKRVFFIELKGSGLNDAIKQIYSTVIYLKKDFQDYQKDARIVGSRDVPNLINTPDYKKLAREILPKGKILRSTNKFYSENI